MIDKPDSFIPFFQECEKAIDFLRKHLYSGIIRSISHFDADGISAAGIVGKALLYANVPYHQRIEAKLNTKILEEVQKEKNWSFLILTDLGSTKITVINEIFHRPVLILDHHKPETTDCNQNVYLLNPHLVGFDGTTEISGAGVAYLLFSRFDERNRISASYAVIGALGDRQDQEKGALFSLNELIATEAKEQQLLTDDKDLYFFRGQTRTLISSILRQKIPELNDSATVAGYLRKLGIPLDDNKKRYRTPVQLTAQEKQRLINGLILDYDVNITDIYRPAYILLNEKEGTMLRDAREFSFVLNALGRMGYPGIGVALIMGDRKRAIEEAEAVTISYRRKLGAYREFMTKEYIVETKTFRYIDTKDKISDKMIGTVTSILVGDGTLPPNMILIGMALTEDRSEYKLSVRVPEPLKNTVDVEKILSDVILSLIPDCEVGGHRVAAGAVIPVDKRDIVLEKIEEYMLKNNEAKENGE